MKIGFWCREDHLLNNSIFLNVSEDASFNKNPQYNYLYNYLKSKGHEINSIDLISNVGEIDCVLFLDFPAGKISKLAEKALSHKKKILITIENEVVLRSNWLRKNQDLFDLILTWNDDFIDNKKYFKIMLPSLDRHERDYNFLPFLEKKYLSCMISWKKKYKHKNETQTLKNKIINYFEENNLKDNFHLYGPNWDETVFKYVSILEFLNYPRFKKFRKIICKDRYKNWKGKTQDKRMTLRNYKFAFVIENATDFNGFITDKIFDCFYSGTVPIYLGAKNVKLFIPEECFIDLREFKNLNNLHDYLLNLDQARYEIYIENIQKFLSNKNSIFSFKYFNEAILNALNFLKDRNN
ncbi:MAG: hypothetical protein CBD95_005220 [Flavobacteriales bacterium TMED235]|nr:MAG: hypothetical protein CBD95_005220 [Flavobacteriales bacterium TMED235]